LEKGKILRLTRTSLICLKQDFQKKRQLIAFTSRSAPWPICGRIFDTRHCREGAHRRRVPVQPKALLQTFDATHVAAEICIRPALGAKQSAAHAHFDLRRRDV
jgi:hypothetical protein